MEQGNLLRETPEGTPLQVLIKSSPHCHLTLPITHIFTFGRVKVT